ncbi:TetR family transcriptional regulator [Agromyces sp. Root81]|uniref:TetR/AcrR family transcriptional regulator n=1 Tax=Agromyces sp. Root81 TaxID=1736601 RepID=UPI0006F34ECD|nr:TetR/AcrR family transcriptional regulator [Agromyces sp. Root81]KRC60984.1 TetR family transcriptional regulator [Agromyces sp. Root81]
MAWDVERTKRLLLEAATAEFSEHGLAGARVDRIASNAGVNKERIYQYFGKKDELFAAVLSTQLRSTMDAVPMTGEGPAAAGDYAGRLFDHHVAGATIPRLVFWEGLEGAESAAADAARAEYHRAKVEGFQRLLPGLDRRQAAELLLTIVTLVNAWPVLGHLDELLVGTDDAPADRRAARRAAIVQTIELLARAAQPEPPAADPEIAAP